VRKALFAALLVLGVVMPARAAAAEPDPGFGGDGPPPRALSAASTSTTWPEVDRIATSDPVVFVTIDDGWTRTAAAHDAIRGRGWPVTSFLVPNALDEDPGYFASIGSPSTYGSHSVTHSRLTGLSSARQQSEICGGRDRLAATTGTVPGWFRPPYGAWDQTTLQAARDCGYPGMVLWDVTVDGTRIATTYGSIHAGDIILLHYSANLATGIETLAAELGRLGLHPAPLADYLPPAAKPAPVEQPFGTLDSVTLEPGGVHVHGWTIDPSTTAPIQVHVYIGSAGFQPGSAKTPRPDVADAYPAFGADHGFEATIPWTAPGPVAVCVWAINVGPDAPNPEIGCRSVDVGAPFGSIDAVADVAGGLRVVGWAIDPDAAAPIDVHVYVNGVGFALGAAEVARGDVAAAAAPRYGAAHGFDGVFPYAGIGALHVCAYGINVGPPHDNSELSCRWVLRSGAPFGALEPVTRVAGGLRVTGWAADPDTAAPIDVHVFVNGVGFSVGSADADRPDVATVHPSFGASHGYDAVVPWSGGGGATVCAYGINVGPPAPNSELGCVPL
jgi:peptidoglycan/xylan/chitin deacetylase (PgdA/CDA1 family)